MSSRRRDRRLNIAKVEDCDENEDPIAGTEVYAESLASPTKANSGKKKSRRGESSHMHTDSDSTLHPSIREKPKSSRSSRESRDKNSDRAMTTTNSNKKISLASRPAVKQTRTSPVVSSSRSSRRDSRTLADDASYYGVDAAPVVTQPASRPRAHTSVPRPASYYDKSRPPLSNTRYHTPAVPTAPFPPPPPQSRAMPIAYPPPPPPQHQYGPMAAVSYPMPLGHPLPPPAHAQPDYFSQAPPRHQSNLAARFGTTSRPQSAMGHRSITAPAYHHDEYAEPIDRGSISRRPSLTRRSRQDAEDRLRMPPPLTIPARPMSARPLGMRSAAAFAPPSAFPPPPTRTSAVFDDDELDFSGSYHDTSPLATYDAPYRTARSRRPSIGAPTVAYDTAPPFMTSSIPYTTEIARGGGSRRSSYYGGEGSKYEDTLRRASLYQSEVDGGSLPLTAETLRKASRRGGSSKSSGSHDESDWKQSATTRTTQSASDEVTIQVLKGTTFKVGGVPLECDTGAVFNISSGRTERGDRDRGSDRSSYMGEEEIQQRRGRHERNPSGRVPRAPSQSASYSRGMGPAAYDYGAYGHTASYGYAPPYHGAF